MASKSNFIMEYIEEKLYFLELFMDNLNSTQSKLFINIVERGYEAVKNNVLNLQNSIFFTCPNPLKICVLVLNILIPIQNKNISQLNKIKVFKDDIIKL